MRFGRNPDSNRPSFCRGPTALGRTNPVGGTGPPISPDSVEPKVVIAGSIRLDGGEKDRRS